MSRAVFGPATHSPALTLGRGEEERTYSSLGIRLKERRFETYLALMGNKLSRARVAADRREGKESLMMN